MIKIVQVPADKVWPVRQQVMYPDKEPDFIKLTGDDEAVHLALFIADEIISVISLFQNKGELQFRKFATRQPFQKKGYGSQLLQHTIQYARQQNAIRLWCNARLTAVGFYRKFGLRETGESFRKNGIDYVVMELMLQ